MLHRILLTLLLALPVPHNVSDDPKGVDPPVVHLDELEMTAEQVARAKAEGDTIDWSVTIVGAEDAWKRGLTGKGVLVAVLDTGIDVNHRDFTDAIEATKDFTGSRTGISDVVGHGTHCAGSIAARRNGWGVVGVAPESRLLIAKVLGDGGSGRTDHIAQGLDWAVAQGAKVASLSLGGPGTDSFIPGALKRAEDAGVIVIAANGNDNGGPVSYPAAYETAIAISAIDAQKRLAGFSNVGRKTEATGPGVGVRSAYPGNRFANLSGTSMATPNVAGVAVLWSQWADEAKLPLKGRPALFRKWLETAEDLGARGRDSQFGWGLPSAAKIDDKPVPQPPQPPGASLILDETDLNEKGREKLKGRKFRLELGEMVAPRVTPEELVKRVTAGETLVVAIGVPLPSGVDGMVLEGEVDLEPGVYRFAPVVKVGVERIK